MVRYFHEWESLKQDRGSVIQNWGVQKFPLAEGGEALEFSAPKSGGGWIVRSIYLYSIAESKYPHHNMSFHLSSYHLETLHSVVFSRSLNNEQLRAKNWSLWYSTSYIFPLWKGPIYSNSLFSMWRPVFNPCEQFAPVPWTFMRQPLTRHLVKCLLEIIESLECRRRPLGPSILHRFSNRASFPDPIP